MQNINIPREKRFFEYLLSLTKLTGKVIRDYREFEKYWIPNELKKVNGCYFDDDLDDEDIFLEIHRPRMNLREKIPPKPNLKIRDWLDFNINNENAIPSHKSNHRYINIHGEEIIERFEDDKDRITSYQSYRNTWKEWAENLKSKKRQEKLYNEFFNLVSRFDREGELLEFVYGKGILIWNHPDKRIGLIRSPLLTQKLELELDAINGIITAKRIDHVNNVERDILSGVTLSNKNKVEEIFNTLKQHDIKDDVSDLFNELVHLIDPNGEYKESNENIQISNAPIIHNQSIFIFRVKKTRILRDDLENIIEQIDAGNIEINEAIKSILGEKIRYERDGSDSVKNNNHDAISRNELFFPLPYNEQQKEIVKRIERNFGVTVQGPPGTGKTHTIANLVSHFLAEGKKVLITSQKENPLKVLKSKIPKEIQDLCVPVLGGGKESLQEIERSINTISEKLGELDIDKLSKNIRLNIEELDASKRKEAELINQLKDYTEKEGTVLRYKDEELYRYDVAKKLANSNINYNWIIDEIEMALEFPLNEVEFQELWNLRNKLTVEDLILYRTELPKIGIEIRNEKDFQDFVNDGAKLAEGKDEGLKELKTYQLPYDIAEIEVIAHNLKLILDFEYIVKDEGFKSIMKDLKAGGNRKKRWKDLLNKLEENCNQLFEYYNKLISEDIKLPDKEIEELKFDVSIAKEHLENGKKPNIIFFLTKGKKSKYLFKDKILNNKPVSNLDDLNLIEDYIKYHELKLETARIFNRNMQEINHANIDQRETRFPHMLEERINELKTVENVFEIMKGLEDKLLIHNNVDLYSINEIRSLLLKINKAKKYLKYKKWHDMFIKELNLLKSFTEKENKHSIIFEIIDAFENQNTSKWKAILNKLLGLYNIQKDVYRFYGLLNKMKKILPLTAKSIEISVGSSLDFPTDYLQAFELKKLKTWLDQTKDVDPSKLRKLIEKEKNTQRKLIKEIVRDSSWKNQIERITESEKRALSTWKTYIKRYGKGTGKNKRYLSSIRSTMKNAQSAIPVWIMPITQVMENFPVTNEKFDVIIFDESSQCDIFSVNVLLRGKKFIVVGDDEQISPQAIGVSDDDVRELVNRYLPDIPNSDLFDGSISLYEIAEQTFPKEGKLMLREHFRCVPEIIQFSNDLSYGGEMIPMRLPLEEEKLEPPVMAVKVNDGYNDEKEKDINRPEAEAIANDIYTIVHDPKYKDQTIGVISLQGNMQHKLLETVIREKIGDAEYVARKIICGNPYDLQGDERDIIFLSMVVAPNRNFRQLTKNSEKQRINVAASRAKNQMRLYHSVDLSDLKSTDYRYALLSYCINPSRINQEIENLEQLCESPFEKDVLKMIVAKGYKVTPQVKVGGYRIDFVIEGIRDRLAVECDGEKWHGPEKFEEDLQRQESLERAGWKFWRIRGREFYLNRKNAMESLWEKLDEMGIEPKLMD